MSRVQLALNVADIDAAVEFYSKLFGTDPAKRQPGYANFAIADPPLKLVLMENVGARGHGKRCAQPPGRGSGDTRPGRGCVSSPQWRELGHETQDQTTCCYAVQDKAWVEDPNGAPWEIYAVLADAPAETGIAGDGLCCVPCRLADRPVADEAHSLCGGACWLSFWGVRSSLPSSLARESPPNNSRRVTPASSFWRTQRQPLAGCTPSS